MAKNTFYIFCLLLAFAVPRAYGAEQDVRAKIKQVYDSQVGVKELTGCNDGPEVEAYLASCGLTKGHHWCAAFISWTFQQAGIKLACAWAAGLFPAKRTIYHRSKGGLVGGRVPVTGDVFGLYYTNLKRIGHVGFIDRWTGNWVRTVEGNTNGAGSRNGDGVYVKYRLKETIYAVSVWVE